MNVTLKQLRAFVALSETGSFTAAARVLSVTPSALSLLVKELEGGVGLRLFDRSTRHSQLSAAGADFFPSARKLLDDLERALSGMQELQAKARGVVRLACSPMYSATVVPQFAAEFQAMHPGVKVRLTDAMTEQVAHRVASGEVDFGIAPERPVPGDVVQQPLFRDRVDLICPPDHPLAASGKPVPWSHAMRYPFVSLSQDYAMGLQMDLTHHSEKLLLQPVHYVSLITTALAMVKWGAGITAQPSRAAPLAAAYGLVVLPLRSPVVRRRICLLTPRDRAPSPASAALQGFMVQRLRALEAK